MLTMLLSGDCRYTKAFATYLKAQPFINVISENQQETGAIELQFTTNIFKPTLLQIATVELVTTNEQIIHIELLHPVETRIDDHIRQITGNSYDIFASPNTVNT